MPPNRRFIACCLLPILGTICVCILSGPRAQGQSFVNWESPHIAPLCLTPDGLRLLAVNTPDAYVEVFDLSSGTPVHSGSIPVGLEPVSVRARSNTEAWVVNHLSDSVSIVDLPTMRTVRSIQVADEPCDVAFAGTPQRAYVTCSQARRVLVIDPEKPATAAQVIEIDGEAPRALSVSSDGSKVYVAIFESGNNTTILAGGKLREGFFPPNAVDDPAGPYGGQNPPPNDGASFNPPMNPANPSPPKVGLIVRKDADGRWLDDNEGDWTEIVSGEESFRSGRPEGWDLLDHDLAVIDTASLTVSYVRGLMNICMAVAVNPSTGEVSVVGTDASNEIRFESNLNGRFLRVNLARVDPAEPDTPTVIDLNPHLTYENPTVPPAIRTQSIGDPRGIAWNASGTRAYVTGMGSNNVVVLDAEGHRAGLAPTIEVGEGPTGIAIDDTLNRLYVLNRFEASISVIDATSEIEIERVSFFDPTPDAVRLGRPFLYDTHLTSGTGHVSCASCHVDARLDRLAWDLGDPAGEMRPFNQNCNFGHPAMGSEPCPDWHPMKGPMVTQTLQDIIGKEPHHWRGDRNGIEEFNPLFQQLQGAENQLTPEEMQMFKDFLATLTFPPNPFRQFDNQLLLSLPLPGHYTMGLGTTPAGQPLPPGNARAGRFQFDSNHHLVAGFALNCTTCHTMPTGVGTNFFFSGGASSPIPPGPNGELHHAVFFTSMSETPDRVIKGPQLRNLHKKIGFDMLNTTSRAGFGFMHDGAVDLLERFLTEPFFSYQLFQPQQREQILADQVALMISLSGSDLPIGSPNLSQKPLGPPSKDTHAAVGRQLTFNGSNNSNPADVDLLNSMLAVANAVQDSEPGPLCSLVAHGIRDGLMRGHSYVGGGMFQSDRAGEQISATNLRLGAEPGAEMTFTVVPRGTQTRYGIDRDGDGHFDRDELEGCGDATNASVIPRPRGDMNLDGIVSAADLPLFAEVLVTGDAASEQLKCLADVNEDGFTNGYDIAAFVELLITP